MRAFAIALALLSTPALADGPDGGTRIVYDCPPGDAPVAVDGGWFVTERQKDRLTCVLKAAEEHRDLALKQADGAEDEHLNRLGVVAAVSVLVGVALGFATGRLSQPR